MTCTMFLVLMAIQIAWAPFLALARGQRAREERSRTQGRKP
jgi:hypothetical protein